MDNLTELQLRQKKPVIRTVYRIVYYTLVVCVALVGAAVVSCAVRIFGTV